MAIEYVLYLSSMRDRLTLYINGRNTRKMVIEHVSYLGPFIWEAADNYIYLDKNQKTIETDYELCLGVCEMCYYYRL